MSRHVRSFRRFCIPAHCIEVEVDGCRVLHVRGGADHPQVARSPAQQLAAWSRTSGSSGGSAPLAGVRLWEPVDTTRPGPEGRPEMLSVAVNLPEPHSRMRSMRETPRRSRGRPHDRARHRRVLSRCRAVPSGTRIRCGAHGDDRSRDPRTPCCGTAGPGRPDPRVRPVLARGRNAADPGGGASIGRCARCGSCLAGTPLAPLGARRAWVPLVNIAPWRSSTISSCCVRPRVGDGRAWRSC